MTIRRCARACAECSKSGPGWHVVAEASNGQEAVHKAEQHAADVAIIDLGMPLASALEAIRDMRQRTPEVRIIALSIHSDEMYVTQILRAGATGYLLKDLADIELQEAVSDVAGGELFISAAIAF